MAPERRTALRKELREILLEEFGITEPFSTSYPPTPGFLTLESRLEGLMDRLIAEFEDRVGEVP